MTESAPQAIKTYSIPEIKEGLQGGLKLPVEAVLKITKPGSKNRASFVGGSGVEIDFDSLRNFIKAGCRLKVSIGESVPKDEQGKARVFSGQESSDKPLPPATSIEEALDLFKQALEKEKTAGQVAFKKTPASAETEQAAKIEVINIPGSEGGNSHANLAWRQVHLIIDGEKSGVIWTQYGRWTGDNKDYDEGEFHYAESDKGDANAWGKLKIPKGTRFQIFRIIGDNGVNCGANITGGKNIEIDIKDLTKLKSQECVILLQTNESKNWATEDDKYEREDGKANFHNLKALPNEQVYRNLPAIGAIARLKEALGLV